MIVNRINSLINHCREDKGSSQGSLVSGLSISKNSHNSILSNPEIWNMNLKQEDTNAILQEIGKLSNDLKIKERQKLSDQNIITANEEDYDDETLNENVSSVQPKQLNYNINSNNNFQSANPPTTPLFSQESFLPGTFYPPNQLPLDTSPASLMNYAHLQQNAILFNPPPIIPIQPHGMNPAFYLRDTNNLKNKYQNNVNGYNVYPFDNNLNKLSYSSNTNNNNNNINKNNNHEIQTSNNKRTNTNTKEKKSKNVALNKKDNHNVNHQNTSNNTASSNNNNTNATLSKKIVIDDIITGKEKRTTLMLRNIPNKYTLNNLVEEINPSFWGKFDYINLPIDYDRKLNLGYAFINFVDPMHIILFYETYRLKKWTKYRSDKKMDMTYADKQGKKDINCKDEQTYFAENDKRFNFSTLQLKIEIPVNHLDFFKKIYTNSVCVIQQDKHPIYNDNCFIVKNFGKKI